VKSAGAGDKNPAPFFLIPDYFSKRIFKKMKITRITAPQQTRQMHGAGE
jgi:hypothetical protein